MHTAASQPSRFDLEDTADLQQLNDARVGRLRLDVGHHRIARGQRLVDAPHVRTDFFAGRVVMVSPVNARKMSGP